MAIEQPITVSLEQESDFQFRITFEHKDFAPLLTDEPEPLGSGRGPNPPRLLLASVVNCLSASLLFALRKYKNSPQKLRARISATPMRNMEGRWRIPRAFVEIQLPEGNEDYSQLDQVIEQFQQFCVVTESVRHGIDVQVTVTDAHGHVLLGDKSFEAGS